MPIYEYRCDNGHHFDVMQKMTDGPVTECEVCGAPVQRVFHPVAVHFKGSGFYNTDYGTARRKRESAASSSSDSGSSSDSKPDSSSSSSSDSSKSSSSSDS
jgi:putative FmdB family regulatory protein